MEIFYLLNYRKPHFLKTDTNNTGIRAISYHEGNPGELRDLLNGRRKS